MTYVEFFEKIAIENLCASLIDMPERIIFVGNGSMAKRTKKYKEALASKGFDKTEIINKPVSSSRLDEAIRVITEIVETYDDCIFDITGGEEILNVALGIVCEKHPEKDIQIHKVNINNNIVYTCDKNGVTVEKGNPSLSIRENVKIYGGDVVFGDVDGEDTYLWDLTPEFLQDVDKMWRVCKANFGYWNAQIKILKIAKEKGKTSADGLTTSISRSALDAELKKEGKNYGKSNGVIKKLCNDGLIAHFDDTADIIITYKDKQIKRCLTQEGQILEMKVFVTAKGLLEDDGERAVYEDALNGVVIDWDGQDKPFGTENEIDVLLMHDIVPVFISCKNGDFDAEELYKLNTVAERFGGVYAKKVLITTAIDQLKNNKGEYLKTRARDMKIKLINEKDIIDDQKLAGKLKDLWQN